MWSNSLWKRTSISESSSISKRNAISIKISIDFNRLKIFLLCFYEAYDVNLWEKKISKSTAYSWNFIILWKENTHSWRLNSSSKTFLNQCQFMGFTKLSVSEEIPEFLDSGWKSWTLDAGLWTLDSGRFSDYTNNHVRTPRSRIWIWTYLFPSHLLVLQI